MRISTIRGVWIVASFVGAAALGLTMVGRAVVHAAGTTTEMTGVISLDSDSGAVVTGEAGSYPMVSAIDFAPFVGPSVVLDGGLDQGTLYVTDLILGDVHIADQQGHVSFSATGEIAESAQGFNATIEGIDFTLFGDELDQVVGQTVQINGLLAGTDVTVTSLG